MSIFAKFTDELHRILDALEAEKALPAGLSRANITVEPPRDASHGDISTNVAMVLAKPAGTNPRTLAQIILPKITDLAMVDGGDIAGPGFINLRLTRESWLDELNIIAKFGDEYGRSILGKGKRANIEYVSANPTGPMHMGHCRGAVVGDALAGLMEFAGYEVVREYYINDAGGQVDVLARSAYHRYAEALGHDVGQLAEGLYPGDYLIPVGKLLADKFGDAYLGKDEAEWLQIFRETAVDAMMDMIRADLGLLGIKHDLFSSEAALHKEGKAEEAEKWLRSQDLVYDGILEAPKGKVIEDWEPIELPLFRSTKFGDDQDRPIKKSDGKWTYFGADMAYHHQKSHNVDVMINIWGADHAGTVKRIKSAVAALTKGQIDFDIKLVQMVKLLRNGEPVKMSKRSGSFVTLAEVVEEVGKDVVRFTMLTRKADAQMDFDFAKVIEASKDNPVFYVQYAHARICSTIRKAKEEENFVPSAEFLDQLGAEEIALIKEAANFPRIVEAAAKAYEPHRIAFYLGDIAAAYHAYWNIGNDRPEKRFILAQDEKLSSARLFLAEKIGQVIKNGLHILGVEASIKM
ncbi:arginine--tRNA ligase [Sphingorhabdus lutea]|uniref:Arginine--tRNA ligase n=1 Tax=Sphingorhabdus lutea TaxID=1913578 RepID=A0A1L3JCY5_9SPHN|nr:arginine--tRNA ligase [Sphingorhabdus lutea]APG62988.1 arginine--tRNA ligase [Sphingorhabdus lutea]